MLIELQILLIIPQQLNGQLIIVGLVLPGLTLGGHIGREEQVLHAYIVTQTLAGLVAVFIQELQQV